MNSHAACFYTFESLRSRRPPGDDCSLLAKVAKFIFFVVGFCAPPFTRDPDVCFFFFFLFPTSSRSPLYVWKPLYVWITLKDLALAAWFCIFVWRCVPFTLSASKTCFVLFPTVSSSPLYVWIGLADLVLAGSKSDGKTGLLGRSSSWLSYELKLAEDSWSSSSSSSSSSCCCCCCVLASHCPCHCHGNWS